MSRLIRTLRHRLADESGYTMALTVMVLLLIVTLSGGAYSAATGDIRLGGKNQDQKDAYAAAEAGVASFQTQLNADTSYWTRCATGTVATQPGASNWRTVPGSTSQYTIELLPATGTTCDPNNATGTMIDASTGTFRVRTTGRSRTGATRRSIVTSFRRNGFLDYIYFTDLETVDPALHAKLWSCFGSTSACLTTGGTETIETWANRECSKYWRDGRGSQPYRGSVYYNGQWYPYRDVLRATTGMSDLYCGEIRFVGNGTTNDVVAGPLHTNDSLLICGTPRFGERSDDAIETEATQAQQPWRGDGCDPDQPTFTGTFAPGAGHLQPPETNDELESLADIKLTGGAKLVFSGTNVTITNDGATTTRALGLNTVIHVKNDGACPAYDPFNPVVPTGAAGEACGHVAVSGSYATNVTVAGEDVVVTGDLTRPSDKDVVMGLIANAYVRVGHASHFADDDDPGSRGSFPWPSCVNDATGDRSIDAAILALQHSFVVDRWGCGDKLGTLSVHGTIAQKYRGAVGTGGTSSGSGYIKDYTYDRRLEYRAPPHFLDPVGSSWRVARQIEQVPAAPR